MKLLAQPDPDIEDGVCYPSSDGQPMGETGFQVRAIHVLFEALDDLLRRRADVYLAADMFWYWEKGNPAACCAPDVMVIPGVGKHERRSFRSWNEHDAIPAVIFEMASENTWRRNLGPLYQTYERLGVKEYFIFDPEGSYIDPPFQGFRLRKRKYVRVRPGKDESLPSIELGVRIVPVGRYLRLADARTGEHLPTWEERAEQESRRAEQESRRAAELEAENARLRAQLEGKSNGRRPAK
jgi:Uma2 family endonuclease